MVFLDFSSGGASIPETLCGPDFCEYFFFSFPFFSIFGPVLSTCREGTPVTGFFFGFFVPSQKAFLALFSCSLGPGFPGLGLVFSRVCHPSHSWAWFGSFGCGVTHPIFGSGSVFWVWSPGLFWPFSLVSIVCQDFLVSFSCGFGSCVFVRTFCYS